MHFVATAVATPEFNWKCDGGQTEKRSWSPQLFDFNINHLGKLVLMDLNQVCKTGALQPNPVLSPSAIQ